MSYCRFSSDDFQCDVYCYEHVDGGFVTHVAGNRVVFKTPLPPKTPSNDWDSMEPPAPSLTQAAREAGIRDMVARYKLVMDMVHAADRVPIELPHAGAHFHDDTLEELLARLQHLREIGYRIPEFVFTNIAEELEENARGTKTSGQVD